MLKRNLSLNTFLSAHDQVIIQDSEDKLHNSVYILNQMSKDYNLKISTDRTKIMAFKGKNLVRSKIEIVKAVSLHFWTGPEGFRKLRFLDFVTTEQGWW